MNSPLSPLLSLLLLCIPAIFLLGRALGRWLGADSQVRAVLTPAFALVPWLLAIHIVGRLVHSFSRGLVAGTLIAAFAGIGLFIQQKRSKFPGKTGERASWWMWLWTALAAAGIAPMAIFWAMHDELNQTGHMSLAAQMLNGVYPPRHIAFPSDELNYHYGFDLLVATTAALTRLRVDKAIDAVTVFCWGWTFSVAWVLGKRATGSRGLIIATMLLLGGGVPMLCAKDRPVEFSDLLGGCSIDGIWPNPPIVSYFFQHPWTLGLPLAISTVLVVDERRCRAIPRYCMIVALLVMLSLSQFTLFATFAPALAAQEFFSSDIPPKRFLERLLGARFSFVRGLLLVIAVLVALLIASRLGGFFAATANHQGPTLVIRPQFGVTISIKGTLRWLAASFGFVLPLGLIGVFFVPRIRVFVLCLLFGSLFIINTLRIKETWDIVKFATIGAIAVGILAGVTLDRIVSLKKRFVGIPLALVLFLAATASGFIFPIAFGLEYKRIPQQMPRTPPELTGQNNDVATFLRARVKPGEVVYRAKPASLYYAIWAGLPQVWTEKHARSFGFSASRIQRREKLFDVLPSAPEYYLAENVHWFVLDKAWDVVLIEHAEAWIGEGRAREVMQSGRLRVIELLR